MAESFGENDWKDFAKEINFAQPGEFYHYGQGDNAGLSSNEVSKSYWFRNLNLKEQNRALRFHFSTE
ncbi:MAG TPA: hypothetical protein QF694_02985 [Dehalococcoidia bacterium]|nr:hypothetical protein [Dehalococcoidia bacterium]